MLLEEKTKEIFGYYPTDLRIGSIQKIYFLCNNCQKEICIQNASYRYKKNPDLCRSCAIRAAHAYDINENYFDLENLQSFYWAGFLFADGTLYPKTNRIAFELSQKDTEVLNKFKKDLDFEGPIAFRTRKSSWKDRKHIDKIYKTAWINFTGEKIYKSLDKYGVTANKTKTFSPPDILNLKSEKFNSEFAKAFLVGLISGDGSVSQHSKTQKTLEVTQYGNYSLCSWVKDLIHFLIFPNYSEAKIHPNRKKLFKYTICGENAILLFNILNSVDIKKIERKWNNIELFENFNLIGGIF